MHDIKKMEKYDNRYRISGKPARENIKQKDLYATIKTCIIIIITIRTAINVNNNRERMDHHAGDKMS